MKLVSDISAYNISLTISQSIFVVKKKKRIISLIIDLSLNFYLSVYSVPKLVFSNLSKESLINISSKLD